MGSDNYYYCCCLLVTASIVLLLLIPVHGDYSSSSTSEDLIEKTCKNTKYYDVCVSSLKSDSISSQASDTKGLAEIMVRVGVGNATATNSYISSSLFINMGANNDTIKKKVLSDCADKYSYAGEALLASIHDLDAEMYDYAYMHVMAASDYPNACHNGFRRYPRLRYPPQLAIREQGFKRICDVLMDMLHSLLA